MDLKQKYTEDDFELDEWFLKQIREFKGDLPSLIGHKIDSIPKDCLHFPVCIAKTPYSFSAESSARGAASNHNLLVREINLVRGAGFIVAICGDVMRMPGLPKIPASNSMTVTDGKIQGLS